MSGRRNWPNSVSPNQVPKPTSAALAGPRMTTDSSSANASQNEAYRIVAPSHTTTRASSSGEGMIPSRTMPSAVTSTTSAVSISAITAIPATNLPLMTSSRWIGWASSRDSVPCARSELMPSKPKAMPTSGTSSAARAIIGTPPTWSEPPMNRTRNSAGCPATCGAAAVMSLEMKYIGTIAAIPMTIRSTTNRMLSRWSASSLPAIVRQPPDGAFSARRAARRASDARDVSAGAAIGSLRDVASVQVEQVCAAAPEMDERQPGRGERGRERPRDVLRGGHDPVAVVVRRRLHGRHAGEREGDAVDGCRLALDANLELDRAIRATRELLEGPRGDQPARREEPHPVAQALDLAEDVRAEEHGEVSLGDEAAEQGEQLFHAGRI